MVTKEKLIHWLEDSHEKLEKLVAEVDCEKEIYPGWTIREILAHFTGWDDAVIASLKSHAAGGVPTGSAPRKNGRIDCFPLGSDRYCRRSRDRPYR